MKPTRKMTHPLVGFDEQSLYDPNETMRDDIVRIARESIDRSYFGRLLQPRTTEDDEQGEEPADASTPAFKTK
ncbi:hypothetical protein FEF26_04290 [Nesterenkonia salmonea]|uniref:Uncharacterized protein n=1 Tax=Nesterenkonia salmonea TaxID=1804987 RepID=A0A5R9BDC2_9MICC|nr:hypothetical protein [Nesterenkonia salmonea]TLP98623.1 hypothetical protein FEF26_04290 [Nesterenkonia salmonea]